MPSIGDGIDRGLNKILGAFFSGIILGAFGPVLVDAGLFPAGLISALVVLSIFSAVMTIDSSQYWAFPYLAGFGISTIFMLSVLSQTHLIGIFDWLLYGGTVLVATALRVRKHT